MGKHNQGIHTAYTPGNQTPDATQYGVDMRGTTDTTKQVHDRASTSYDREHDGGFWNWVQKTLFKDGDVNSQVHNETSQDASTLAQGVTTRQAPGIPGTNYMTYQHDGLKSMVKDGVNPGMSMQMSDAWIQLGNDMVGHQNSFVTAIGNSETEWRGASGDSARNFMADVANYIGKAGQSAQLAGKQESLHSQALSTAGNSMPDPINFDAAGDWTVRFHFYETCNDAPEDSPHGHAAFFVHVP